ncbi:MAG: UDP-N-acetylmuramoyl-L-alanine--D-glutamate ligase [Thermotaleaceae bacterium]
MKIKDKNILVVGMAISGASTVNVLLQLGCNVTVHDAKKEEELQDVLNYIDRDRVQFILGQLPENVMKFDLIVLSPGVPTDLPFLLEAREAGVAIIGELELAYQLSKATFIAITGTNGKTTTTALTGEIYKNAAREAYVVGNIGVAAISKSLEVGPKAVMITEVSSFQLESVAAFKPHIAAILNITPDHLNRHKTMENYIAAKGNIFKNQTSDDILILNMDDEEVFKLKEWASSEIVPFSRKHILKKGAYVENGNIVVKKEDTHGQIVCSTKDLKIPGEHNLENALAAVAIAYWGGIEVKTIKETLKSFMGVEHRIEFVDEYKGVRFINDSKGTNPDSSIKAIETVKAPIILIAGGMDKGGSFEGFITSFHNKVKYLVLIGETANKMKETANRMGFENCILAKDMEDAVKAAYNLAEEGDTILLSPACASWDMYKSFEHRGAHFKECIGRLRRPL